MNKIWDIYTVEYYSAIKGNKLSIHCNRYESQNNYTKEEEARMGVGSIYYMISFMWNFRKGK